MNDSTPRSTLYNPDVTIPIAQRDYQLARQVAAEQFTPEAAQQWYHTILALRVVQHYLQLQGIARDTAQGESANPVLRLSMVVGDLWLPGRGKVECCPITPQQESFTISPAVWRDRLAYVAVELDLETDQGILLGFIRKPVPQVRRSDLRSMPELLEVLTPPIVQSQQNLVRLGSWLNQLFSPGWQQVDRPSQRFAFRGTEAWSGEFTSVWEPIETLYAEQTQAILQEEHVTPSDALCYLVQQTEREETRWLAADLLWEMTPDHPQAGVRRCLDLRDMLGGAAVRLMIGILPTETEQVSLLLRVLPLQAGTLPDRLQLRIRGEDDQGNAVENGVEARSQDDYIQFKLLASFGERFTITVSWEAWQYQEEFLV
ncbi:MAG: DUF1822 family protein [Synechococcales bacterium]|nr:DUF1822 family protein [Synechococcales bacterium]